MGNSKSQRNKKSTVIKTNNRKYRRFGKIRGHSEAEYLAMYRQLKGEGVIDWKVKSEKKLSTGNKSAITKAIKQFDANRGADFVQVAREKGESKTAYKRRLATIKRQFGKGHTNLNGIHMQLPTVKGHKVMAKFEGTELVTQNYTIAGKTRQTRFVPITDKEYFVSDPEAYIQDLIDEYKPDEITAITGSYAATAKFSAAISYKSAEMFELTTGDFIYDVIAGLEEYEQDADFAVNGFMLEFYK